VSRIDTPNTPATAPKAIPALRWYRGLPARLFALTLASVLILEGLIFIPSASNARTAWLKTRVQAARIAALALEAAPARAVSDELADELLMKAEVLAVAEMEDDMRIQLLAPLRPIEGEMFAVNLQRSTAIGRSVSVLGAFTAPQGRVLVVTDAGSAPGRTIEVVVPQAPLKAELQAFARRMTALSVLIALVVASVIYVLLHLLVVRPMQRVTQSVVRFQSDPGSWTRRLATTTRSDEIGQAQNALSEMETVVADSFRQRAHLAELGAAVAKINHDLRNSLASAQLVSDTLGRSDDPRVQRAAPRLERALQRAIQLASDTLAYGKTQPQKARVEPVDLRAVVAEAALEALGASPTAAFENHILPGTRAIADADHLHRIAANLIRNAAEAAGAGAVVSARCIGDVLAFADNGPGLPAAARANLFKPFSGSARLGGTGLGLVIARELAESMGAKLVLAETGASGTVFHLTLAAPR
jgi:signal transduction histidine kinase